LHLRLSDRTGGIGGDEADRRLVNTGRAGLVEDVAGFLAGTPVRTLT